MVNLPKHKTDSLEVTAARPTVSSGARVAAARNAMLRARHIAIVTKLRYMGDTIVATPCLSEMRQRMPHAEITLITCPAVATALANCPYVDRVVTLHARGRSRVRQTLDLLAALRERPFDGAFLLNRSFHCALTSVLAGIPVRVGYATELRGPLITVPVPYRFDRHEVALHLNMLDALGWETSPQLPELWISEAERAEAHRLLEHAGWQPGEDSPLVAVQPGSNDADVRAWGAERFAAVADALAGDLNAQVVLMGGAAEKRAAERMLACMKARAISFVGQLELRSALSVIGHARLWIGNDTGLLHAAVAQRVPSVGIFGPNKLVRWGYASPLHRSVAEVPGVAARTDREVRRCLDRVSVQTVLDTALDVYRCGRETQAPEPSLGHPEGPPFCTGSPDPRLVSTRSR